MYPKKRPLAMDFIPAPAQPERRLVLPLAYAASGSRARATHIGVTMMRKQGYLKPEMQALLRHLEARWQGALSTGPHRARLHPPPRGLKTKVGDLDFVYPMVRGPAPTHGTRWQGGCP
jgi:hypothetical protein